MAYSGHFSTDDTHPSVTGVFAVLPTSPAATGIMLSQNRELLEDLCMCYRTPSKLCRAHFRLGIGISVFATVHGLALGPSKPSFNAC